MEQQIDTRSAINLGVALRVIGTFLDLASQSDLRDTEEYVAARCVYDRLAGAEEPAS